MAKKAALRGTLSICLTPAHTAMFVGGAGRGAAAGEAGCAPPAPLYAGPGLPQTTLISTVLRRGLGLHGAAWRAGARGQECHASAGLVTD